MSESIPKLAEWIKESQRITVLSGAGISTSSGIPDFRSTSGLWTNDKSRESQMSLASFNQNRKAFWPIFKELFQIKMSTGLLPNYGHEFLADLEKRGKKVEIFTQNVDGLHQEAGSRKVFEVHGSIKKLLCTGCRAEYPVDVLHEQDLPFCYNLIKRENVCNQHIPIKGHPANYVDCSTCGTRHDLRDISSEAIRCKGKKKRVHSCNKILKPDVVLFGDQIRYYKEAKASAVASDLFIVMGSSLQVKPINEIPLFASNAPCKTVIINNEATELDGYFDLVIHQDIVDTMKQVKNLL